MKLTPKQREAIEEAIATFDAAWDFDAARGLRDSRGGMEYEHQSYAVVLRELLEEAPEV